MHELSLHSKDKTQRYEELLPQICSLINEESDLIANLANTAAVLKEAFCWFWVGSYLVKQEELVLGPFQGPLACTRIPYNRGVCGQSWAEKQTLVVPDVNAHPGHIACSSRSQSEIVVPVMDAAGKVVAVLDVDSENLAEFDSTDAHYLQNLVEIIAQQHFQSDTKTL